MTRYALLAACTLRINVELNDDLGPENMHVVTGYMDHTNFALVRWYETGLFYITEKHVKRGKGTEEVLVPVPDFCTPEFFALVMQQMLSRERPLPAPEEIPVYTTLGLFDPATMSTHTTAPEEPEEDDLLL